MAADTTRPGTRRFAIWALLGTTALWGLSFPLGKTVVLLHQSLAPEESGWFFTVSSIWPRFLMATLLLLPLGARPLMRVRRAELAQGMGLAVFMSAGLLLQMDGLQFTQASTSAFLSQGYVVLLPLVVFGRLRRWPPLRIVLSTATVMTGVAILAGVDWRAVHIGRGEAETLVSTLFFTGQILWLERAVFYANRPVVVTSVMFAGSTCIFIVAALLLASEPAAVVAPFASGPWLGFSFCLAAFCTFGAITLMNTYQRFLSATEAGLIYAAEPVWASIMALFLPAWFSSLGGLDYPNEVLTTELVIGGALICAANVVIQLKPPAVILVAPADGR